MPSLAAPALACLCAALLAADPGCDAPNSDQRYASPETDDDRARKVAALVRVRETPDSAPAGDGDAAAAQGYLYTGAERLATRRRLTRAEREAFDSEGYVVLRGFFAPEEVAVLKECLADPLIMGPPPAAPDAEGAGAADAGRNISIRDADGRDTRLTLWWEFGNDTFGRMARSASLVQAAAELMGGLRGPPVEPFCSHTKVLLKEPRTGGAWEWHGDFGYWYAQGLTQPDKILSCIVAIDRNDRENGAMRVLTRSHRLGRLDHGVYGGQAGADPDRVLAAMASPGHRVVTLELEPGDVAFTHSNLLHCSRPNDSDRWRRNVIAVYNGRGNEPPADVRPRMHPPYKPIAVESDRAVLDAGCVRLDPGLDFLAGETSKAATEANPAYKQ